MFTAWFFLACFMAVLQWVARWRGWKVRHFFTKPAAMIALIAWSWQLSAWRDGMLFFGLGLLLSLVGDVFLMLLPRFFLPGLASFLFAHLCYLIGFSSPAGEMRFSWLAVILALCLLISMFFFNRGLLKASRQKSYGKGMQLPIILYSLVISSMLLAAFSTLLRPAWLSAAAYSCASGALLFCVSDSMLAFDRFIGRIKYAHVWIMMSYHIAQFLIILGALLQFSPLS